MGNTKTNLGLPKMIASLKPQLSILSVVFFAALYFVINLFVLVGDWFVFQLNAFLVIPLSILTSGTALLLWRQMKTGNQSRIIWGGLLAGWGCWALAEFLWAVYSLQGLDPYPSPADLFFAVGYIPLLIGLSSRTRNLPITPNKLQYFILGSVFIIIGTAAYIYVLSPILQSYNDELFLESVLGLFYPLADLLLLLICIRIFLAFGSGMYGMAWRLILIGFITVTVSDLVFSYADWNDLYYPESKATIISTVVIDWLYNMSYVFWAAGIYALRGLLDKHEIRTISTQPPVIPNTYALVFTDKDGMASRVSQNCHQLFPTSNYLPTTLETLLGISRHEVNRIQTQIQTIKKIEAEKVFTKETSGKPREIWISGLAMTSASNHHDGAIILLRMFSDNWDADIELSDFNKSVISNILSSVKNDEAKEVNHFFSSYYISIILSLYNLTLQEGGAPMAQSLLDKLHLVATTHGWEINFNLQLNRDSKPSTHSDLPIYAWKILLTTAKNFTSQLTDDDKVENCMQDVHAQFNEVVSKTLVRLESRLGRLDLRI